MKELLLHYAQYNAWANKKMIDALLKIDAEDVDKQITSSFPSVKETVYHCWGAEFIWLQRLELEEKPVWIPDTFEGTFDEACREWQLVSEAVQQFVKKQYDDKAFEHVLQYYDRKKKSNKMQVSTVLLHVCNHATYHRGQLVTMMRQLGIKKLPSTDFSTYPVGK